MLNHTKVSKGLGTRRIRGKGTIPQALQLEFGVDKDNKPIVTDAHTLPAIIKRSRSKY